MVLQYPDLWMKIDMWKDMYEIDYGLIANTVIILAKTTK